MGDPSPSPKSEGTAAGASQQNGAAALTPTAATQLYPIFEQHNRNRNSANTVRGRGGPGPSSRSSAGPWPSSRGSAEPTPSSSSGEATSSNSTYKKPPPPTAVKTPESPSAFKKRMIDIENAQRNSMNNFRKFDGFEKPFPLIKTSPFHTFMYLLQVIKYKVQSI